MLSVSSIKAGNDGKVNARLILPCKDSIVWNWGSTCRIRVATFLGGGGYDLLYYPVSVYRLQITSRLQIEIIFLFLKEKGSIFFLN